MANRFYSSAAVQTTLSSSITNAQTTIAVGSTTGYPVTFPYLLILDEGTASEELVDVTAAAGTTLTVARGVDSTTGLAHSAGATVKHGSSGRDLREPQDHMAASSSVHGVTGSVVGTTDTQTLTNKTLTGPVIDQWGTASGLGAAWTAYTPTYTNFTISGSPSYARYKQFGKKVVVNVQVVLAGAPTGQMAVSLPVTASSVYPSAISSVVGVCTGLRQSVAYRNGIVFMNSTTTVGFLHDNTATAWNATSPHTWAATDVLSFTATYEAA